jgi:hypothetical protein
MTKGIIFGDLSPICRLVWDDPQFDPNLNPGFDPNFEFDLITLSPVIFLLLLS